MQLNKNEDVNKELWRSIDHRKKLENELRQLESEIDMHKANLNDQGAANIREITMLR